VNHVSLTHIIIADEHNRLILGLARNPSNLAIPRSRIYETDPEELVVENPVSFTILLDLLTSDLPGNLPSSNQPFQ